jgi:energy-coupling factor transport system permease protein
MPSSIEYLAGDSFLHRLDPRSKLILLLGSSALVFAANDFLVMALLAASILILWRVARIPLSRIRGYIKFLLGLILFLTLLQVLLGPGDTYFLKPLIPEGVPLIGGWGSLKVEGLYLGLLIGLRIIVLVLLIPLLILTTRLDLLALALTRLGLPYKGAYVLITAINLIPGFEREVQAIMDAQRLRGLRAFDRPGKARPFSPSGLWAKLRSYPALASPLIFGAMRKAQFMAQAMDARGFGAHKTRVYLEDIHMERRDYLALALGLSSLVLLFLLSRTLGLRLMNALGL